MNVGALRSRAKLNRSIIINNLMWLLASLLLAFFVWFIAITEDIQERRFNSITVQVETAPGLLIVDQGTRNVRVTVRAPQSIAGLLTAEDIIVRADLSNKGPGTHTVELNPVVSRNRTNADTQPRQITITLEEQLSQQVQVTSEIIAPPPISFEAQDAVFGETQVMATGASSQVQQVVAAQANIDLSQQRDMLETVIRLVPVDADGDVVDNVTLEPQNVSASIEINQRGDLKEVRVSPDIRIETLAEGYALSEIIYEPQEVIVIGAPEELALVPNTLSTEEIDLTGRTSDFEILVPVVFPSGRTLPILGEQLISVSVDIVAQTSTIELEGLPVTYTGVTENFNVEIVPESVNVLVSGPQAILNTLSSEDIRVSVDLNNLDPGIYEVIAIASSIQAEVQSVSVLPTTITITISEMAEATETLPTTP